MSEIVERLRDVEDGFTAIDDKSDLPKLAADALEEMQERIDVALAKLARYESDY